MGRKDKVATVDRKSFQEVRAQARCDVRERYSVGQRWLCLEEAVKSEDRRRQEFYTRIEDSLTRNLPLIIQKFLRTLKRSVRFTMLRVGGTPYSIVRGMFLHWDQDHSGHLCIDELIRCVRSLGVEMNRDQLQQVLDFYTDGNNSTMSYHRLLEDLRKDEPGMLVAVSVSDDLYKDADGGEDRFRTRDDIAMTKPACIEPFLAALRDVISMKLRNEGGTPESHLRSSFLRSDSSCVNVLKVADFSRAMRVEMSLAMSDENAAQIVAWYDRAQKKVVDYKSILIDLCKDMPGLMTHVELTADQVKNNNLGLKNNCFVPKQLTAAPNRCLEFVKSKIRESVHSMVLSRGGTLKSWVKEAFSTWDPRCTGFIEGWGDVQGAVKRLGVTISVEEARTILRLYEL